MVTNKGRLAFTNANNCKGQLQTPQSVSALATWERNDKISSLMFFPLILLYFFVNYFSISYCFSSFFSLFHRCYFYISLAFFYFFCGGEKLSLKWLKWQRGVAPFRSNTPTPPLNTHRTGFTNGKNVSPQEGKCRRLQRTIKKAFLPPFPQSKPILCESITSICLHVATYSITGKCLTLWVHVNCLPILAHNKIGYVRIT
jgi:hypothetical protein